MKLSKCMRISIRGLLLSISLIICVLLASKYFSDVSKMASEDFIEDKLRSRLRGTLQDDDPDLVRFLRKHVLQRPSEIGYNLSTDFKYIRAKNMFSSGVFIDDILKRLFSDEGRGFFVEAGALDGEFLSNTLWLEREKGWTGLLIEPENTSFRDLVWKRRKAWLSHSCLSDEKFPKLAVMVSIRMQAGIKTPGIVRGASYQDNYNNFSGGIAEHFYKVADKSYYMSQCYPLYSSLLALNVSVIDFLSFDMQGAEVAVFKTIPLNQIFIRAFVVENMKSTLNYELISLFNRKGFDLLAVQLGESDYFFVNRNDSILRRKAKLLGMAQRIVDKHKTLEYPALPFGSSYEQILGIHQLIKRKLINIS